MYGAAATWRRRWYAQPSRARRLEKPVVSVGNLRAGGSGKTPVVAHIARLLVSRGERPVDSESRLRAGPARRSGVTVVSDGKTIRADVAHAGDEPFMLAQALPGVPVLVDRRPLSRRHASPSGSSAPPSTAGRRVSAR